MARAICQQIIANITGREASEADILRLEDRVRRRMARLQQQDATLSENAAIRQSIDDIVAQDTAAVSAKRRATLLNEAKRLQAQGRITGNWGKQYGLGLRSLVTGTQRNVKGARYSAAGQQDAVSKTLIGGLHGGIAKLGREALRVFTTDAMEDDIARALWHLRQETPDAAAIAQLPDMAVAIAQVVSRMQELARVLANKEGAAIGRIDGYITRQSHDVVKIAADRDGWLATAMQTFDLPRMMADMGFDSPQEMLESLYTPLSTGLHLKVTPGPSATVKRGLGSLASRLSKERVIHFRGADEFMAYNRQFGAGNLRESVVHGLSQSARSIGLMQVLGTNPAAFLDAMEANLLRELRKTNPDAKAVERFHGDVQAAKNRLKEVDGSLDVPGNNTLARWSQNYRTLKTMASLGGSMLSSFSDVATFIVSARHNGINLFQATDAALRGIFTGRNAAERAERASALGVVFDSLSGRMVNRFSVDEGGQGALSFLQQKYYQLNLQNWWSDGLRFAAADMLSHNLAFHADKAFADLPPELSRTLGLYGMDSSSWNVARQAVQRSEDGKVFLSPDNVKNEGVRRVLQAYFTDQNGYLLLSPDAETRYLSKMGTQKGTAAGEIVRMLMQFKSFTVSFNQRMIGRELVGNVGVDTRGAAGVLGEAGQSSAAWLGMAQLFALTTTFGYASMAAKDAIKGKTPRDPSDPRTAIAAMQQGGGLGIMGDFLFGRDSRTGGDALTTALGPAAGDVGNTIKMWNDYREAALEPDADKAEAMRKHVGDQLFRMTYSNIPGNNLFYVKPVMDYLVMWQVQEMLNPGAMQRMEKRANEAGQTYFVSPAERVREQRNSP